MPTRGNSTNPDAFPGAVPVLCYTAPARHIKLQEEIRSPSPEKLMNFENLIKPDSVLCNVNARSKKHCLEILSELLTRSMPHIAKEDVFAKLIERERLGCTSLDKGIAFPHCRIGSLEKSSAALIKLLEPVDFDAIDGDAVDLVFGLVVPKDLEQTDYDDIDVITSVLRNEDIRTSLRAAATSSELYDALISGHADTATGVRSAL